MFEQGGYKGGRGIGLHFGGKVFLGAAGIVVKYGVRPRLAFATGSGFGCVFSYNRSSRLADV